MEYLADGAQAPPSSAKPKEEKGKETPPAEEEGKKREDRPLITVTLRYAFIETFDLQIKQYMMHCVTV